VQDVESVRLTVEGEQELAFDAKRDG